MKDKKGRFVKGHTPPHKGKTKEEYPKLSNSGVKKGNIPWNVGKLSKNKHKHKSINNKRILNSRYVFLTENTLGWKYIPEGFVIHHINLDESDDRIENLACIPRGYHMSLHHTIRKNGGDC